MKYLKKIVLLPHQIHLKIDCARVVHRWDIGASMASQVSRLISKKDPSTVHLDPNFWNQAFATLIRLARMKPISHACKLLILLHKIKSLLKNHKIWIFKPRKWFLKQAKRQKLQFKNPKVNCGNIYKGIWLKQSVICLQNRLITKQILPKHNHIPCKRVWI